MTEIEIGKNVFCSRCGGGVVIWDNTTLCPECEGSQLQEKWLTELEEERAERDKLLSILRCNPVPPESLERCYCGGYGTHYEVCENDPVLLAAMKEAVDGN